ncbi:hypothetical protein [Nocardia acidivorans]|uniref:hypothetical protein n=1 Tax=Nocardia acidivorans TaxID=404580 RepID=UPI0008379A05|nr:hypothetical protein [Nocardia acidivorans]
MPPKSTYPTHAEYLAKLPPWTEDPLAHLVHTIAAYPSTNPAEMAIYATMTTHLEPGVPARTGITWGDLRAVAAELGALRQALVDIRATDHRQPPTRLIATPEDAAALPDRSIVVDRDGDVWQARGGVWCSYETSPCGSERLVNRFGPITLISDPESAAHQENPRA